MGRVVFTRYHELGAISLMGCLGRHTRATEAEMLSKLTEFPGLRKRHTLENPTTQHPEEWSAKWQTRTRAQRSQVTKGPAPRVGGNCGEEWRWAALASMPAPFPLCSLLLQCSSPARPTFPNLPRASSLWHGAIFHAASFLTYARHVPAFTV